MKVTMLLVVKGRGQRERGALTDVDVARGDLLGGRVGQGGWLRRHDGVVDGDAEGVFGGGRHGQVVLAEGDGEGRGVGGDRHPLILGAEVVEGAAAAGGDGAKAGLGEAGDVAGELPLAALDGDFAQVAAIGLAGDIEGEGDRGGG